MFRSIRLTLLFWYAVVLLGSIALLGTVLHRQMRSLLYREADAQLAHWVDVVRRAVERGGGTVDPGRVEEGALASLPGTARFAVFDASGDLRAASEGYGQVAPPPSGGVFTQDDHRWQVEPLPDPGGWIVVGRSVREENHGIRCFLIVLLVTGAGVAVLALFGGYWLVARVLAPAREIARAGKRISARNLGERIPLARVPSELLEVATTLNESFGRLQQSFAAQAAFTADASHELRTPLAILRSHLELAVASGDVSGQLRQRLAVCQEAVHRLETIVASLLTLARADAGDLPFDEREVDLAALVESEVEAMAALARRRGIVVECRTTPVTVLGDRDRLRQVVTNLVDNAIRYDRDGGRVEVSVARDGDEAVVRVADTGIGIAEEHRDRIFERFFRVDQARSRSQGGSGLGLAIVRHVVERHGGSIAVDGRLGEGAEFRVRLPMKGHGKDSRVPARTMR